MHYRERLREWIGDHDLKQKKLAGELDITESVISNYMTGRSQMPIEMLVKMADHFGVSVDYLAGVTPPTYTPIDTYTLTHRDMHWKHTDTDTHKSGFSANQC